MKIVTDLGRQGVLETTRGRGGGLRLLKDPATLRIGDVVRASETDFRHAQAVGRKAVQFALKGMNATMPVIRRISDSPYRWRVEAAPLERIANAEKTMPDDFIREDGYGITEAARRYLQPLIRGEAYPPYGRDGLPKYARFNFV